MTKQERVLQLLETGMNTSQEQIAKFAGVENVTATISDLRSAGYSIYTNTVRGQTMYRLGRPTRAMVAAAYKVGGAKLFQR